MTASVIPFKHPTISAWQSAYEAYWDAPAPHVTRCTNKGFIIHGSNGDSRLITESHMQRLTKAMLVWAENREGERA
jgi:hypothetical protein